MVEVPVTWCVLWGTVGRLRCPALRHRVSACLGRAEIDGSTMDLMSDAPKMARDIAAIRIAYTLGVWSENDTSARLVNSECRAGSALNAEISPK